MHEQSSVGDRFWNLVAAYIDERDLTRLGREWPVGEFVCVAIHVTSCISCLTRRLVRLNEWVSPDDAAPS